ncbi:MAG: YceI family protein [Bacteroidales bacterium]|nr:YceI family protein [Bacteroidales bacterium]
MKTIQTILLLLASSLFMVAHGQSIKVVPSESKISVEGTSTIHDWEMSTSAINGSASFSKEGDHLEITGTKITLKATDLKSDNSGLDDKAHEALKAKKQPSITFTQTDKVSVKTNGNTFTGTVRGNLTIAGETKAVSIPISGNTAQNKLKVNGKVSLKMTQFGMEPPRAMLGTIRAGDEITVNFEVVLK